MQRITSHGLERPEQEMLTIPFEHVEVCMLTRNEESLLETSLPPLAALFPRFSIVDQSSTDRTTEILRDVLGEKLNLIVEDEGYLREIGFAGARNKVSEAATGPWLFHIDADERIALPEGAFKIEAEEGDETTEYFNVRRRNICRPTGCDLPLTDLQVADLPSYSDEAHVRLYRNSTEFEWRSFIHEELWTNGRRTLHSAPIVNICLNHLQSFKPESNSEMKERFYGWMIIRGAARSNSNRDRLSDYSKHVLLEREGYFREMAQEYEAITGLAATED